MIKRIAAVFLAAMMIFALGGCGKALSEREYFDALSAGFDEYIAALNEMETIRADVTSSQEIMEEHTKATEICERARAALKKLSSPKPPAKFAAQHKKLLTALEMEREYVDAVHKVLTARTPDEMYDYTGEVQNVLMKLPEDKQLGAVYKELITEVKNSLGE